MFELITNYLMNRLWDIYYLCSTMFVFKWNLWNLTYYTISSFELLALAYFILSIGLSNLVFNIRINLFKKFYLMAKNIIKRNPITFIAILLFYLFYIFNFLNNNYLEIWNWLNTLDRYEWLVAVAGTTSTIVWIYMIWAWMEAAEEADGNLTYKPIIRYDPDDFYVEFLAFFLFLLSIIIWTMFLYYMDFYYKTSHLKNVNPTDAMYFVLIIHCLYLFIFLSSGDDNKEIRNFWREPRIMNIYSIMAFFLLSVWFTYIILTLDSSNLVVWQSILSAPAQFIMGQEMVGPHKDMAGTYLFLWTNIFVIYCLWFYNTIYIKKSIKKK